MAINPNSTTTITYRVWNETSDRTMESATNGAASFAAKMLKSKAWSSASIANDDAENKLKELMASNVVKTHVNATPQLFQLTALAKKLETASTKRLVTETERGDLLMLALLSMKELGMSHSRVTSLVNRVYPAPAPADIQAPAPAPAPMSPAPMSPAPGEPVGKSGIGNPFKRG